VPLRVESDAGEIQPTELNHLTREEQQDNIRLACQLKVRRDMNIHIPESVFSIKKYSGTVISNRNVATFIKELVVEPDNRETIRFEAGQYMQIDIPEYNACFTGFDVADQYLASWERLNFMDLCVASMSRLYVPIPWPTRLMKGCCGSMSALPRRRRGSQDIPSGVGSSYVFNLKPGDRVTFSGPYGDFLAGDTDRKCVSWAVVPAWRPSGLTFLHQLNTITTRRKISFWYGARSWQEMFYFEEFRDLAERFDNFSFQVALSDPKPEDNWQGPTGFIHNCLYEGYSSITMTLPGSNFTSAARRP